jgi:hypothetical protein
MNECEEELLIGLTLGIGQRRAGEIREQAAIVTGNRLALGIEDDPTRSLITKTD